MFNEDLKARLSKHEHFWDELALFMEREGVKNATNLEKEYSKPRPNEKRLHALHAQKNYCRDLHNRILDQYFLDD